MAAPASALSSAMLRATRSNARPAMARQLGWVAGGDKDICSGAVRDRSYDTVPFRLSEIEHRYGPNVHVVANPFLLGQLATLCARETRQPAVNRLVRLLYEDLIRTVLNAEFPRRRVSVPTRMIDSSPQAIYEGEDEVVKLSERLVGIIRSVRMESESQSPRHSENGPNLAPTTTSPTPPGRSRSSSRNRRSGSRRGHN